MNNPERPDTIQHFMMTPIPARSFILLQTLPQESRKKPVWIMDGLCDTKNPTY